MQLPIRNNQELRRTSLTSLQTRLSQSLASGKVLLFFLAILWRIILASSHRPFINNHRGDSGSTLGLKICTKIFLKSRYFKHQKVFKLCFYKQNIFLIETNETLIKKFNRLFSILQVLIFQTSFYLKILQWYFLIWENIDIKLLKTFKNTIK